MIPQASSARAMRLGLTGVILICSLLSASTWRVFGHTWDEPEHLAAGMELLDRGKYEYDTEHPPLARALIALGPLLAGSHSFGAAPPDGTQEGIHILYDGGHYDRTLTLARLGALPFLTVLLLAMWLWARRVARTDGEALLGVILLATVPPVLGHAALAALDIPGTATTLLALYLLQRWLLSGSRRDAVGFGVATGAAVATKLSAVPFIAMGMMVLAILQVALGRARANERSRFASAQTPCSRRLIGFALVMIAATVPVTLAYGGRSVELTLLPPRFSWVLPYLFQSGGWARDATYALVTHLRLPEAAWDLCEGVVALKAHNDTGHMSFLLGQSKADGWWYFYLVALAVKTPLPLLATGPVGLGLLARNGWRDHDAWRLAPLVLFVTILAFASGFSRINIGIRHVLILYPFLALGGAYTVASCWRWLSHAPRTHRTAVARVVLAGLVGWQVSTWWSANPDYFPYFNEAVSHPQEVLIDSDLDWGQDLRRLERRLAQLKIARVSLAYRGTADLSRESLPTVDILPPRRVVDGWIAISALAREHDRNGYAWLDAYRPVERVGKTIDLYFIPQTPPHR
jgi:hypothetical protein